MKEFLKREFTLTKATFLDVTVTVLIWEGIQYFLPLVIKLF